MKTTYTEYKEKMHSYREELRTRIDELELVHHEEFTVENGLEILKEDVKDFATYHLREVFIDGKWVAFGHGGAFGGTTEGSIMRTTNRRRTSNYKYFFIVGKNNDGYADGFLKVYKLDKDTFPVKVAKKPFVKYG
jgi:hypothetical protein